MKKAVLKALMAVAMALLLLFVGCSCEGATIQSGFTAVDFGSQGYYDTGPPSVTNCYGTFDEFLSTVNFADPPAINYKWPLSASVESQGSQSAILYFMSNNPTATAVSGSYSGDAGHFTSEGRNYLLVNCHPQNCAIDARCELFQKFYSQFRNT